ncbi:MAG: hypothetical protein NWE76_09810, partial [Candidatus Bathyarchaeota archaeon]|nr:hypothetical protein [Candidatus Bathyarchaeota archaeon]
MEDALDPVTPEEELQDDENISPPSPQPVSDDDLGLVGNKQLERRIAEEEEEDDEPKRGRKKKKRGPSKKTVQRQKWSREMSFEEWVAAIETKLGWQNPGVEVQLTRIQPEWHKGVKVGGLLDSRECAPFSQKEVMERFGGGTFQVVVSGPRPEPGLPPISYKKRFSCAGIPKIPDSIAPDDNVGQKYRSPHEHEVEKGAVSHLGALTEQLMAAQLSGGGKGAGEPLLEKSFNAFKQLTDDRAKAREEAAHQARIDAESRYNLAKEEAERLRVEMERSRVDSERKSEAARGEMNTIITTMLPQLNDSASKQIQYMMATFQSREERIEANQAKEIESIQRGHNTALQQAEMLRQAELQRIEAMFTNQMGIVQAELVGYKTQLEAERIENRKLREEIMKLHTEQLSRYQQEQDPIAAMGKYAQVAEFAKEFVGGSGGGGENLSDEAPDYMKLISQVATSFGPAISQVLEARGGVSAGPQAPGPQQLSPQQEMAIHQAQQQQMMQA